MASHLADWAAAAAPENPSAHAARAKIYEARAAEAKATMSRGIFRAAAEDSANRAEP